MRKLTNKAFSIALSLMIFVTTETASEEADDCRTLSKASSWRIVDKMIETSS